MNQEADIRSSDRSDPWQAKASMILPLMLFFVIGMLVNVEPIVDDQTVNGTAYLAMVAARVVLMTACVLWFGREILRQFPLVLDQWGWITGGIGAVLWIGICELHLESSVLQMLSLSTDWLPAREGVDPFITYAPGVSLISFLIARFLLLAVCVPVAEELFLRGFLMRSVESEDWTELSLSSIGRRGVVAATIYAVATHPGEIIAAIVWFSLVTWMMFRTGKFWNCVVAHAVTNFLLGVYVCWAKAWYLW